MIVFHTTHCPKCNVLETKLNQKNIEFVKNEDVKTMLAKGIVSAPYLEIDGHLYDFTNAIKWVNEQ